jgi:hypothetical protein
MPPKPYTCHTPEQHVSGHSNAAGGAAYHVPRACGVSLVLWVAQDELLLQMPIVLLLLLLDMPHLSSSFSIVIV